jgi:hypothetical protein
MQNDSVHLFEAWLKGGFRRLFDRRRLTEWPGYNFVIATVHVR